MDKATAQTLTQDLQTVLNTFAQTHDLDSVTMGSITYDNTGLKTSLRINEHISEDTRHNTFNQKARRLGLPEGLLDTEVTIDGQPEPFIIRDINTRAKKYPIVVESASGDQYRVTLRAIQSN